MASSYNILTPEVVAALDRARRRELEVFVSSIELCETAAAVIRWAAVTGDGPGSYAGPRPATPSGLRVCERACRLAPGWLAERMAALVEQFTQEMTQRSARYRAILSALDPAPTWRARPGTLDDAVRTGEPAAAVAPVAGVETDPAARALVAMGRRAHAALLAAGAYRGSERDALTDIRTILQEAGVLELLDAYLQDQAHLATVASAVQSWQWSELTGGAFGESPS